MENKLPSEFAILCKDEKEAKICIDWAKRNNIVMWSDLPFTADRCYFLKTKHNDYFFSTVKDGLSLIPLTSLTEEQGEIIGYECPMDLRNGLIPKGTMYVKDTFAKEFYHCHIEMKEYRMEKEIVETWKPIYKVKTQREIDHEIIDGCEKEFMKAPFFDDFFDYLKENNYAIVKREYEN